MKAEYGFFGYVLAIFIFVSIGATAWVADKGSLSLTLICGAIAVLSTAGFGLFVIKFVFSEVSE